jgi:hypothetical protein
MSQPAMLILLRESRGRRVLSFSSVLFSSRSFVVSTRSLGFRCRCMSKSKCESDLVSYAFGTDKCRWLRLERAPNPLSPGKYRLFFLFPFLSSNNEAILILMSHLFGSGFNLPLFLGCILTLQSDFSHDKPN